MRLVMSADVYKDYLLGLVFYKALSDKILVEAYELLNDEKPESLEAAQKAYEEAGKNSEVWSDLQAELEDRFGCAIRPRMTFSAFYQQINERTFMLDDLSQAFRDVEAASGGVYAGLFDDFGKLFKNPRAKPDGTKMFCSAFLNDARMCCFFANAIVKY